MANWIYDVFLRRGRSDASSGGSSTPRVPNDDYVRGFDRLKPLSLPETTYTESTRTFSAAVKTGQSEFYFWTLGKKYIKTAAQSIVWPDVSGVYYFYFDTAGALKSICNPSWTDILFIQSAIVGMVYWNKTEQKMFFPAKDEAHGIIMPGTVHLHLHLTQKFKHVKGGELIGAADNSSTYTKVTAGRWSDESILHDAIEKTSHKWLYRDGAAGGWKLSAAADNNVAYMGGGSVAYYNENTSGTAYQLTLSSSSTDYIINYLLQSNASVDDAVKCVGTQVYSSRGKARDALKFELHAIDLYGLPSKEMEFQYAWIAKRNGDLEDDGDGHPVIDLRGVDIKSI